MTSSRIALYATLVVICLAGGSVLSQRAGSIDTITPAAARPGDSVTIAGRGFGAINVRVTVGGVPAPVVAATGSQVTFRVPPGVPHGPTTVTAINPGGQSGSIAFHIIEGVLLPGAPSSPAIDATVDLRELGVDPSLIDHHVILTRLDVRLAPNATVGQINAALMQVSGGIVSMSQHQPMVTIGVPRQPSIAALQALADRLSDAPGILIALVGRTLEHQVLPASSTALLEEHTLPTRFPAAWNVMSLAARDCETRRIPVLVADAFIQPEPNSHVGFDVQVPNFDHSPVPATGDDTHGYDVTTTLTALFDDKILTGANPLANCVFVHGIELDGVTIAEGMDRIVDNLPNERFIVNLSQGFAIDCDIITLPSGDSSCTPASVAQLERPFDRAWHAAYWKLRTHTRWNDFFVAASAGNNRDEVAGIRYPGLGDGRYNSFMTVAKEDDPFFDFITDAVLWRGTLDPNLPDLTATAQEVASLTSAITADHLETTGGAPNTLIVGSTKPGVQFSDLTQSLFSGSNADVSAVGEDVRVFSRGTGVSGTSFSAPQVAGLASYLWLLSDDLRRNQPIETTRRDIAANARTVGNDAVIDAYATVLSLDAAQLPTPQSAPIRLALLDVDNNGHFDEADIQVFAAHLLDANGNPVAPSARDHSRYDLNGDGFTGGSHTETFDLDRVHSTQFGGAAAPIDVTQTIEGNEVHFDESSLTDAQILCYYSYSALYTGDPAGRAQQLTGLCGVSVTVTPSQAQVVAGGGTAQFAATVHGSSDPRVTWSTDAPGATIGNTGLFTAGATAGTFTVTATSAADPTAQGTAHVTITGAGPGHGTGDVFADASGHAQFDPDCPSLSIKSPGNVASFSKSLHCAGHFIGKPPEFQDFTATGDATTTFSETDLLGELTSATATGVYVTTATAVGPYDPNLPLSFHDNAVSEAKGSYKLNFTVSHPRTVTLTGTLTGNASSVFLQFGCGNVAFASQAGAGPVDHTFTLQPGQVCSIEVESIARARANPPPQTLSPTAGFELHVEVH